MTEDEKELIKKLQIIGRTAQINNLLFYNEFSIDEITTAALRLAAAQLDSMLQVGVTKAANALRNRDLKTLDEIGEKVAKDTKDHLEFETMKTPKGGGH